MNQKHLRRPTDFEKIMHFNCEFGIIRQTEPQEPTEGVRESALGLIREEVRELKDASTEEDRVDALVDIRVVVGGYAARCGIDLRQTIAVEQKIYDALRLLEFATTKIEERAALDMIEAYTLLLQTREGYNVETTFDLIHENNMSKLCVDEEDANLTVAIYQRQHAEQSVPQTYATPYACQTPSGKWTVRDRERKKILKSRGWKPPSFQ